MTADKPVLEVVEFTKIYRVARVGGLGKQDAVAAKDITFQISPGEALAIIGESGSGKSTIARSVVGLERPTSGRILINGRDWSSRRLGTARRRERGGIVQMVFQDPYQSLDPRQKIGSCIDEILRVHTGLDAAGRSARVAELLAQVQLPLSLAQSLPKPLSGGQRQRVAIARALAAEPELLVLDEAVSALDLSVQAQVLRVLADVRRATGVALLFISHDLGVVAQVCERVLVMRRGEVVEQGGIAGVLGNPQAAYTAQLIDSIPRKGWKPRRRLAGVSREAGAEAS